MECHGTTKLEMREERSLLMILRDTFLPGKTDLQFICFISIQTTKHFNFSIHCIYQDNLFLNNNNINVKSHSLNTGNYLVNNTKLQGMYSIYSSVNQSNIAVLDVIHL